MKEKDLIRFMDRMIEERKAEYALGTGSHLSSEQKCPFCFSESTRHSVQKSKA